MSLLTDDRGATPHERGATDAAHFTIPATLWALDGEALAVWVAGFVVMQVVQMTRPVVSKDVDKPAKPAWRTGLAWGDLTLDVATTAAGPAAMIVAGVQMGDDPAAGFGALIGLGCLYTWRHRKAWGLAS